MKKGSNLSVSLVSNIKRNITKYNKIICINELLVIVFHYLSIYKVVNFWK